VDRFTLTGYEIQAAPEGQILVLVAGNQTYKSILSRALPTLFMSRTFDDRYGRFEWGTYIHNADDNTRAQVEKLLKLFQKHIYIQDDLTETFALDYHTEMNPSGSYSRTEIGELVYRSKPYHRPVAQANYERASDLSRHLVGFIQNHPTYSRAEIVIPVPPSQASKPFDLPTEVVRNITNDLGMTNGSGIVRKVRATKPMKDCETSQEKINNLRNAFAVSGEFDLHNREVLLVDDIYESGFTINEVGRVLFEAGAKSVLGLVATKTARDV